METAPQSDSASSVGIPVVEQNEAKEESLGAEASEQRDRFARTQRRKLPDERKSITHKFSVAGHEGYIIVGMYQEGTPGEIFIKMAKEGSTLSGFMDGVAVSISIGLQYGVPLRILVDKLTNTRFEPSGFTENPSIRYASSILDYLARWLGGKFISRDYLKTRAAVGEHEVSQPAMPVSSLDARDRESSHRGNGNAEGGDAPSCPTCGMLMVPNGSC